jgi:hypothetical protein
MSNLIKSHIVKANVDSPFVISWSGVRLSPPAPETKLLVYESLRPTLTVVQ